MANIKRIILTRQQLNEVLKEENTTTVQISPTANTIPSVTNAVTANQPEINNASKYGDVNLHISSQKLTGSNDSTPTQHVEVERGQNVNQAIQQQVNPTVLSDGGDIEVSGDGISEHKKFTKRQIEEARFKKIHEGFKMTKKQLQESFDTDEQWNDEIRMFMRGLRSGDYILVDDTLYVEIFKGQTSKNDPRYVYIRKGDNRLQDDHFYIQHSPCLKPSIIREIYSLVGWEPDENYEDYYQLNEDEVDWNQRKQMRMDNFWDTLEYYIGLKDEQGGLNHEQLADAKEICDKLSCFGADAEEFCDYAREVLGLNSISESYAYIDNTDDVTGGFDIDQFISDFREIEKKYYDLPEDYELQEFYNRLLDDWTDLSDEERLANKSFREYCNGIMADYLSEKYAEKGMNKIRENKIEIKPENKGKFNAAKKRTGKSTEELTHSKNPLTRKRAVFAQNTKHWNKK